MKFDKKKVLVIGDLMLDVYRCGQVVGISQESPTPRFVEHTQVPNIGAAGNVAVNLKMLGMEPYLIACVADDEAGRKLRYLLLHVDIRKTLRNCETTIVKTRWMDLNRQLFRVDREDVGIDDEVAYDMGVQTRRMCRESNFDAVIISDYGKGVVRDEVLEVLPKNLFVAIDPFPGTNATYPQANLITPNGVEYLRMQNGETRVPSELEFVTMGEGGMQLRETVDGSAQGIPAECRNPTCVVGAGDVVIACATVALLNGYEPIDAARYANTQAGIAVGKPFTSVVEGP